MGLEASCDTLAAIWTALNEPPRKSSDIGYLFEKVTRTGWVSAIDLEDAITRADRRLDRHELSPKVFAEMLGLPWRFIYSRPDSRFDEPIGFQSLSATDTAAVLILLERLGFNVDAEPLCRFLRPIVRNHPNVTWEEIDILFHDKSYGRSPPLTITSNATSRRNIREQKLRLANGYRADWMTFDDGTPLWLTVHSPKHRARPAPVATDCEICGMNYMKGLPAEDKEHRKAHRRRLAVLEPRPHRLFARARLRDPENGAWVDRRSPHWKYDLVYRRAWAFKREMKYDFVQWASKGSDDPEAVGFLFADDENRILGACGFRPSTGETWVMDWIWVCPCSRRKGLLKRYWPLFQKRFGNFRLTHPLSDAMQAFVAKYSNERIG